MEKELINAARPEEFATTLEGMRAKVVEILKFLEVSDQGVNEKILKQRRFVVKLLTNIVRRSAELSEALPNFRFNQLLVLQNIIDFLKRKTENDEVLIGYVRKATGAGKTVTFGALAALMNVETLILVPSANLLYQTREAFVEVLKIPKEEIGLVGDLLEETGRKYTIMTYQSLNARHRKGQKTKASLVICDEVHKALGTTTYTAIEEGVVEDLESDELISQGEEEAEEMVLGNLKDYLEGQLVIGFTATDVLSAKHVSEKFGELIAEVKMAEMVRAGILKKFKVVSVRGILREDEDKIELTQEAEQDILTREDTYNKLLDSFTKFRVENPNLMLRTVAFCSNIESCKIFQQKATASGLKSMIITGSLGKNDLSEAEEKLMSGEIDTIISVDKLTTGWDFPALNAVIWARATSSPAKYIQGCGRACRSFGEERMAYIFETTWRTSGGGSSPEERSTMDTEGGGEGGRESVSRRALTLAGALAMMGEEVKDIIENSENIVWEELLTLDKNGQGVVLLNGLPIPVLAYSHLAADRLGCHLTTLRRKISENRPTPVGKAKVGGRICDVFRQADLEELFKKTELKEAHAGIIMIDGKPVRVSTLSENVAATFGVNKVTLWRRARAAGLKAVGKAKGSNTDLYRYDEIEVLFQEVKLGEDGCGILKIDGEEVIVIGSCATAADLFDISLSAFGAKLKNKLKPVGKAFSDKKPIPLYRLVEVEELLGPKLEQVDENGCGFLKIDGKTVKVVGSTEKAALHFGISYNAFKARITEKGIQPVGQMRSYRKKTPAYPYEEVKDAILRSDFIKLDPDGTALMELNGARTRVVGITASAEKVMGYTAGTVKIHLDSSTLLPVGKAFVGNFEPPVYKLNEILELMSKAKKK